MSQCPYCGDTRLSFNPRPTRQFDEGDLFHCNGCGGEGESVDLVEPLNRTCKECGTDYHDPGGDVDDPRRHCPECGSRAWFAGPAIV
jgi:DNA-directed RNA polymerase subunit RPC12/RpoP